MAIIDCVIDTKPMAKSIDRVANHIDGTTTAVVAMQTAVIKAQSDAADDVCRNVNRGFYSLIHSQISQKIAKWKSEVDSLLLQLNQQRRQLNSIRDRMEHDYGMLAARYTKLFGSLNRALQRRVYELDKAAFRFAITEIDTINNRGKQLTATVPIGQTESISVAQKLMASNIKHKASGLIEIMRSFLLDLNEQKALTARVLLARGIDVAVKPTFVPIAVWQGVAGPVEGSLIHVTPPAQGLTDRSRNAIINAATDIEHTLPWKAPEPVSQRVRDEFNMIMADFNATPRIKETMTKLLSATEFQTLKIS